MQLHSSGNVNALTVLSLLELVYSLINLHIKQSCKPKAKNEPRFCCIFLACQTEFLKFLKFKRETIIFII